MTIISAAILLFLVLDPVGNIPVFLAILKDVEPKRRRTVLIRELFIALVILIIFLFGGKYILAFLHVSQSSLGIAGGIILFIIAIRMIFQGSDQIFPKAYDGEPFVVPIAIPLVAGPSAMTTLILFMAKDSSRWLDWLIALVGAWALSGLIILFSDIFSKYIGRRTWLALERLMGMLLAIVSVEMFISALQQYFWK